jgi:hypothetical protein
MLTKSKNKSDTELGLISGEWSCDNEKSGGIAGKPKLNTDRGPSTDEGRGSANSLPGLHHHTLQIPSIHYS